MTSTLAGRKPNIVLILADDLGFSDLGCYGGEIRTPHLDSLAASGLRLSQFYNTARCSPSRASLLTGLHPHQTGIGVLTGDRRPVGYPGSLNQNGATLAEMLRDTGYRTGLTGKWHLSADAWNPDESWPTRRGFDYFYGTLSGGATYYYPETLVRGETPIREEALRSDYYYTDAISEEAVHFIEDDDERPFFLYVAYTAPHWPLHAPRERAERYRGVYDEGWETVREQRLERQKSLGIVAPATRLSEPETSLPEWSSLTDDQRAWQASRMEVYAAQVEIMDEGVGHIIAALEDAGIRDDTIVVFLSDNGASSEEIPHVDGFETKREFFTPTTKDGRAVSLGNRPSVMPGPDDSYASYGESWANVSNTPFRLYKKWVHEGGIAAPLIWNWPEGGGRLAGRVDATPLQLTHVVPTLLEAAGVVLNSVVAGRERLPLESGSIWSHWLGEVSEQVDGCLYWEHSGNSAIRRGPWKLVRVAGSPWELYDLDADPTERSDVRANHPEIATDLFRAWCVWADRVGVLPFARLEELAEIQGRSRSEASR